MNKQYYLTHSSLKNVYFKQSKDDFVVTEIPLYQFSNSGEHLVIQLRKKDLTTWEALELIAKFVGCRTRDIGYAGLKDKNALTTQYISINKKYQSKIEQFAHPQIKFLSLTYHNNKIKMGHLKGNRFFIRFKRVQNIDKNKIESALQTISTYGMANYFGTQRFGITKDNYTKGYDIIQGKLKVKDKKLSNMYINAYQSYLFNQWLSKRVEFSKIIDTKLDIDMLSLRFDIDKNTIKQLQKQQHPFKILQGDIMHHYPYGKIFYIDDDIETEALKFLQQDRVPTGLLCGKKVKYSKDIAYKFESNYIQDISIAQGSRRFAWVYPTNITSNYKEDKNWFEFGFELPKGSYATELINHILLEE
jgi:tRNA pseudouridine13 synthase